MRECTGEKPDASLLRRARVGHRVKDGDRSGVECAKETDIRKHKTPPRGETSAPTFLVSRWPPLLEKLKRQRLNLETVQDSALQLFTNRKKVEATNNEPP